MQKSLCRLALTILSTLFALQGPLASAASLPSTFQESVEGDDLADSSGVSPVGASSGESRLRLHHLHTDEWIDVAYRRGGLVLPEGVARLNHFLRDHRTNDDASYPVAEFDVLHDLLVQLRRPNSVIEIVCGYRTAASNRFLRTRSRYTGVAEHSQHILSNAIDLKVPGVSTERLRDAALSLGRGGVGYYPRSGFVHVDVGGVREWSFGERHRFVRASYRRRGHAHGRHRASRVWMRTN